MQKQTLFFLMLFLNSIIAMSQKIINNKLTNQYQNIVGSKISLIIPNGFSESKNFMGLQQEKTGSSIAISDIPEKYAKMYKAFSKENLLMKGIEIKKTESYQINNLPAILITATQNIDEKKYSKLILIFGNENETIFITAAFPYNLKKYKITLKESMLSVFYDETKEIDPFATIDFTIDISNTNLMFAKNISNALIYNIDGQIPTIADDKTTLIVSKSISPITQNDQKQFSIKRIKQMPIEIERIDTVNEITVAGINGYEILATSQENITGDIEKYLQVILFSDNFYYIFFGTTNDKTNKSITDFKNAIYTFKRKE